MNPLFQDFLKLMSLKIESLKAQDFDTGLSRQKILDGIKGDLRTSEFNADMHTIITDHVKAITNDVTLRNGDFNFFMPVYAGLLQKQAFFTTVESPLVHWSDHQAPYAKAILETLKKEPYLDVAIIRKTIGNVKDIEGYEPLSDMDTRTISQYFERMLSSAQSLAAEQSKPRAKVIKKVYNGVLGVEFKKAVNARMITNRSYTQDVRALVGAFLQADRLDLRTSLRQDFEAAVDQLIEDRTAKKIPVPDKAGRDVCVEILWSEREKIRLQYHRRGDYDFQYS